MNKSGIEVRSEPLNMLLVDENNLARRYFEALNRICEKKGLVYRHGYHYSAAVGELKTKAWVNGQTDLHLLDLGGAKGYSLLRKNIYIQKNCFIVLIESNTSFETDANKWLSELRAYAPATPILLVEIKSANNSSQHTNPSPSSYAKAANVSHMECSLDSEVQVLRVLSEAIKLTLSKNDLAKFIAESVRLKNYKIPKVVNHHTKDEMMQVLSGNNRANFTFFRLLPDTITNIAVGYSLHGLQNAADVAVKAALADAGLSDPPTPLEVAQSKEVCIVM